MSETEKLAEEQRREQEERRRRLELAQAGRGSGADAGGGRWEPLVEFNADVYGPTVPVEAFPEVVGNYIQEVADVHQLPPDLPAAVADGVTAIATARRAEIAIGETHVEPLNNYVMPIAPPGERKAQAIRAMMFPIEEVERGLVAEMRPVIAKAMQRAAILKKRIEKLQKDGARAESRDDQEGFSEQAAELQLELDSVPAAPCLVLDDTTPENLAKILYEQGGKVAIVSEEAGTLFAIAAGQYSKKGDPPLDVLLKGYDGGQIRVGRVTRDAVHVESPALTIVVTAQPSLLDRIADQPDFRGRGLLGRIAFVMPPSLVGTRMYQKRSVTPALKAAYGNAIRKVLALEAPSEGIPRLRLEGPALDLWALFANEVERDQAEGGRLVTVRDWASKHAGRVARMAGRFHLIESLSRNVDPFLVPITEETVAAAGTVGQWQLEHALVAFTRMGADPIVRISKRILGWVRRNHLAKFSLRDCHRNHPDVERPELLIHGLEVLEERGFIRLWEEPPRAGAGRRPSPSYEVNPRTHRDSVNSVNCGAGGAE